MKLLSTVAAVALLASPAIAASTHGVGPRSGGWHAVRGELAAARPVARRAGLARVGFRSGPSLDRRERFGRRRIVVPLYPYWGWDCVPDGGCGWDGDAAPDMVAADEADAPLTAPAAPAYAAAAWPAPRVGSNECSDWIWRPRLRHSVCVRPVRS